MKMHLKKLAVRNFRRLQDVVIDLASDISIFVGSNNSGKTSVGHALQLFTAKGRFNIHDFSSALWSDIVAFGEAEGDASLPTMEADIWFEIGSNDVHRVIDLCPALPGRALWLGCELRMRQLILLQRVRAMWNCAHARSMQSLKVKKGSHSSDPSPRNLREFLSDRLNDEYELRHFVLDPARFDVNMVAETGYVPALLAGRDRSGREILNGLLRIDFLNAQRHLSDTPGEHGPRIFLVCSAASMDVTLSRRGTILRPCVLWQS